jgi:hypothetical protein
MKHDQQVNLIIDTLLDRDWWLIRKRSDVMHHTQYPYHLADKPKSQFNNVPTFCGLHLIGSKDHLHTFRYEDTHVQDKMCQHCLKEIQTNPERYVDDSQRPES